MPIVYRHRRVDTNEVFYIGIGRFQKRAFCEHKRNRHWKNVVNQTDYIVEILTTCKTWDDACELEQLLIQEYGRRDLGTGCLVNMTDGGEGSIGMVFTKSHRDKISKSLTGVKKDDVFRKKVSDGLTGRKLSKAHRKKISESQKGIPKPCLNVPVIQYNKNGEYIGEYESMRIASRKTPADASHIGAVCSGKRQTAGGYIWKFKKDVNKE